MRHIFKMGKLETRAVINFFCKKGMPPKEIHEYFMETLGKESPYSMVKKGQQNLRGGERALRMMDVLSPPEYATADETFKVVQGRDLQSMAS